jgi:uncharacterized membrane protein
VNAYFWLKTAHVISAAVLFGTGLGIAFFKWSTDRSADVSAIRFMAEKVVLADWVFTTPAIVVQATTGFALAILLGYPLTHGWVAHAIGLFLLAGACWIPVVWLQYRMRVIARASERNREPLSARYWTYARVWFCLGVPAFSALLVVFWLMVVKPGQ